MGKMIFQFTEILAGLDQKKAALKILVLAN
jgi:hypothetical protein